MKQKLIIAAVVLAFVIIFCVSGYAVYKKIAVKIEAKKRRDEMENDADLAAENKAVTITNSQAQAIADSLKEAFGVWGWGTDEEAVYRAFDSVGTVGDIYLVMKKFGTHDDHSLTEWVCKELNGDEKEILNRKLTDKNIDYKF